MKEETFDSLRTKNRCGISRLLNGWITKARSTTLAHSVTNSCLGFVRRLLLGLLQKELQRKRSSEGTKKTQKSEGAGTQEKVYDILNAGPRNRFCTPWAVAHNCLGLTYGQFARGFQAYAKTFGLDVSLEEAADQVRQFKKLNPKLVAFWKTLERGAKMSRNDTFEIELPSGRSMKYFNMTVTKGRYGPEFSARPVRGEAMTYYSYGKFHNNLCQGTARDVLGEAVLAIEDKLKLPVVLTVHDEVLVEVDEADAKDAQVEVSRIMATPPEWLGDIPLASDCFIFDRYEK